VWTKGFHEIVGGTDRLPAAFASRLRRKPRMGCEVIALEQDAEKRRVAAVFREADRVSRLEGDVLLCTLPFPVLSRIRVTPPLSAGKQRAIRELNYDSSTKILAVTRRRFWEADDGIFGGGTFTDLPTGTTWYPSSNAEAKDPRVSARAGRPARLVHVGTGGAPARVTVPRRAQRHGAGAPGTRAPAAHGADHGAAHRELELGQPSVERRRVRVVHAGAAHGAAPSRRGAGGPPLRKPRLTRVAAETRCERRAYTFARWRTAPMFSGACLRAPRSSSCMTSTTAAETGVGTPASRPCATTWPFM
jgi:hypothetical protein